MTNTRPNNISLPVALPAPSASTMNPQYRSGGRVRHHSSSSSSSGSTFVVNDGADSAYNSRPHTPEQIDVNLSLTDSQPLNISRPGSRQASLNNNHHNTIQQQTTTPVVPPRPASAHAVVNNHITTPSVSIEDIESQLKTALHSRNIPQLKALLQRIQQQHLNVYPILLSDAQNALAIHTAHQIADEIGTLRFYINQSIEAHNIDALQLSLDKSQSVVLQIEGMHSNMGSTNSPQLQKQYTEFLHLVAQARTTLIAWQLEDRNMLQFYITQGIKQRHQQTLSQALTKAQQQPGLIPDDIMKQANVVLAEIDAEHTAKYYIKNAVASKNVEAITTALNEAAKLNMTASNSQDVASAQKTLAKLQDKERRKADAATSYAREQGHIDMLADPVAAAALGVSQNTKSNRASWHTLFGVDSKQAKERAASPTNTMLPTAHPANAAPAANALSLSLPMMKPASGPTIMLADVIADNSQQGIPTLLVHCCEYLRANPTLLNTEGIFRLSGIKSNVDTLLAKFLDSHIATSSIDLSTYDVHDIASCIKLFFRSLQEPLLTFNGYDSFIAAGQQPAESSQQLTSLQTICQSLPAHHQPTLQYTLDFLYTVAQHSADNKMNAKNLAVVFAPTLCKPRNETPLTMLNDTKFAIAALTTLITHHQALLTPPPVTPTQRDSG